VSRKWRGGSDNGGRFRKTAWRTWTFGHSLCEGAGCALGEDGTPEIITRVIKWSAGVSGTPAQGCTQEREGEKPRPGTTGADESKGEAQTFSKERLEQAEPWILASLGSKDKELPRDSHAGDRRVHADLLLSKRERSYVEQDRWSFEDEKVAGVHWGYEETRTLLAILSQTEFYEALRNCHRNSQVYGAVAERLREYGFLRTLEQCRTKFKGLQKSYRKVKSGHPPETCPFFEEMEALMSAQVIALPCNSLEAAVSLSGQMGSDAETEEPQQGGWQQEEGAEAAMAEESGSDEADLEATPQDPNNTTTPVLFRSPSGAQ
uniref:Zinc finger and SCAN domain containing 29 n=1 Tax=Oryctolagus cuniculus TaxID=9986 RepID=A0A5F9C8A8_RABIT